MPTLNEQIMNDLKEAMKQKDQSAMTTLRALKSAIKYAAIEKVGADGELPEIDAIAVVNAITGSQFVESHQIVHTPRLISRSTDSGWGSMPYLPLTMSGVLDLTQLMPTSLSPFMVPPDARVLRLGNLKTTVGLYLGSLGSLTGLLTTCVAMVLGGYFHYRQGRKKR
jgi:hypothetical protein